MPLTPQQQTVAELIGHGLNNREIAGRLVISVRTVETHARNIRLRLGLRTRAAMIGYEWIDYDEVLDQLAW